MSHSPIPYAVVWGIILKRVGRRSCDISDTRKFLLGLGASWYRINVATPLAGSEMFIKATEMGYIKGDIRSAGYKSCVIETPYLSPRQVEDQAYALNLELNFLNNTDMSLGNFKRAKDTFLNVVRLRDDHALAQLMLSLCFFKLGEHNESYEARRKVDKLLRDSEFWRNYFSANSLPAKLDRAHGVLIDQSRVVVTN